MLGTGAVATAIATLWATPIVDDVDVIVICLKIIARGCYDYRFLTFVCPIVEVADGAGAGGTLGIVGKGNVEDEVVSKRF